MQLIEAEIQKMYIITKINMEDEELHAFLFTLGCYESQKITVISKSKSNVVVAIKDGRYSLDKELGELIMIQEA